VDAHEVDATDHVGCEAFEERLEDLRQGADVRREQHAAAGRACEVRGPVQADDGLAGAGSAADACRAVEAAADELGVCRVEERHPVLDRRFEHAVEELVGQLVVGGIDRRDDYVGFAGKYRCRDDDLWRCCSAADHGEVVQHRGEDLVDAGRRQAGSALRDVPDEVVRTDHVDRCDAGVHPLLAGECGDRMDLTGRQARVRQCCLGAVREVGEAGDVVGDVLLAAGDPVAVDRDLAPGLRVDDEDACAANDDHVHLCRAAAWPAAVGEQVVPDAGEWREDQRGLALRPVRDLESGSALFGVVGLAAEFLCVIALAACFDTCRFPGDRHLLLFPWAGHLPRVRGHESSSWGKAAGGSTCSGVFRVGDARA